MFLPLGLMILSYFEVFMDSHPARSEGTEGEQREGRGARRRAAAREDHGDRGDAGHRAERESAEVREAGRRLDDLAKLTCFLLFNYVALLRSNLETRSTSSSTEVS